MDEYGNSSESKGLNRDLLVEQMAGEALIWCFMNSFSMCVHQPSQHVSNDYPQLTDGSAMYA